MFLSLGDLVSKTMNESLNESLNDQTRSQIQNLVGKNLVEEGVQDAQSAQEDATSPVPAVIAGFSPGLAPSHSSPATPIYLTAFAGIVRSIRADLEGSMNRLLALNPSRREAVARHLDRLARIHSGPSLSAGNLDAGGGLRRWLDQPLSPSQKRALRLYFEEIAKVVLGQAMVLKAWSERGIRPWGQDDLGKLNWSLSCALKPFVPLDRMGWQITSPNLYSWYNPSPDLQEEIWQTLEGWSLGAEGPGLLGNLLRSIEIGSSAGQTGYDVGSRQGSGFDERFYGALWSAWAQLDPVCPVQGGFQRKRMFFSPTLRDGTIVRSGPAQAYWIGLEQDPFQLMVAELLQLWRGPTAPPLWSPGNGLEVHSRDQLSLALSSPKPSLLSRISEMEACDLAIVQEENCVRLSSRSNEATRFRDQLEHLPYFRKLRSQSLSLGMLQACVAMNKLRPKGLMFWAREEQLSSAEGEEALGFLLDRGRLVCEWDLSRINHSLPGSMPLFPPYFYVFERETDIEKRLSHRPHRISVQGQIRSHVEVPHFLDDVLSAGIHPQSGAKTSSSRGHWQIHHYQSPTTQKEWAERWPDPASYDALQSLERLKTTSAPLATIATIRPLAQASGKRELPELPSESSGDSDRLQLILRAVEDENKKRILSVEFPNSAEHHRQSLVITLRGESWVAPIAAYLRSPIVAQWLDHFAERKSDRWVLTESVVKFIPIPGALIQAIEKINSGGEIHPRCRELVHQAFQSPLQVIQKLGEEATDSMDRSLCFAQAAAAVAYLEKSQRTLLELVRENGKIRWGHLMRILPAVEQIGVSVHPGIQMTGSMPPHLPIMNISRVRSPGPGILLSTESGFHLHLGANSSRLLDILEDQLEGIEHPTWSELVSYLKLPKNLDLLEITANDVLRSHAEESAKLACLRKFLSDCPLV